MANAHLVLCAPARLTSRRRDWRGAPVLPLRIGKGRKDVHLHINHLTKKTCAGAPAILTDLLEVAAYVYAADQVVTRGGTREFEYGQRWRRRLRFEIPVRRPEVWQQPEVTAALAETLGFLSDDDYEFGFTRFKNPPPIDRYLFDQAGTETTHDFQEAIPFSGGLDSLGGAVQEILQGQRKVALVSHRPVSKLYARQGALVNALTRRLADRRLRPLHVAVEVNKGKSLGWEFTQRSRSFLFASLAAVVARFFNLPRIRFYENGVVSLNLPLSPQLVGGRASRTTHPQVLQGFRRFFSALFEVDFGVENPFLWKTKAEVLAEIRAAGHGDLCAATSSCTHTWAMTTMHTHCGRCSQCVDRRLSALAAGLGDAEDPPGTYASDVLTGARDDGELTLVERYLGTALRVEQFQGPLDLLTAFPEVSRVLGHVDLPRAQAGQLVLDLYRRHAGGILQALSQAIQRESEEIVRRRYPPNCLLSIACGRTGATPSADQETRLELSTGEDKPSPVGSGEPQSALRFVLDDERFEARMGDKRCPLGNTLEYRLLGRLSRKPGTYVSIHTLRQDVWDDEHTEKNTIQRTVCNLRRRLRTAKFSGLEIDGKQRDHYRLVLPSA